MSRIRRKTFVRVLAATVAIYICIRMFRYLSNETAPITMRYPKAILPNEEDTRELRTAIVECKFSIMYEDRPSKCNDTPLILLLVVSSPNNILHRFMLRKYLAPVPNLPFYSEGIAWRIVFVISRTNNRFLETKIKKEIAANGDIILGRYRDAKRNLVYKTLIGLGWATCSCLPKYLLKVNDDVFVNLRIMTSWLFERTNGTFLDRNLYTGISTAGHFPRPIRDKGSELFVSKDEYAHETYAPFIIGTSYLLSLDVLRKIVPLIPYYSTFSAEDAYIGMLARKAGILPQDNKGFIRHAKPHIWTTCDYRRILISFNTMARDFPTMFSESLWSEKQCLPVVTLFPENHLTTRENPQI